MGNLNYIDELGQGEDLSVETEATEEQETNVDSEDISEDFVQDSNESEEEVAEPEEDSKYLELKKQIEGMEKRIADKDAYIQELREASKQKEAKESKEAEGGTEEEDFWDNPEGTIKSLKETIKLQQLQIQETIYANTVENYWKTVNPEALREAVATDPDFADRFNKSAEPYKTAYEYLTEKTVKKSESEKSLREQIKAELLAEMGVKKKKEAPPSINIGSSSGSTKTQQDADGFSSVFGSEY